MHHMSKHFSLSYATLCFLMQIRLESKGGKNSSVMFCTNGVLLRVLIGRGTDTTKTRNLKRSSDDAILGISHIIVVMCCTPSILL